MTRATWTPEQIAEATQKGPAGDVEIKPVWRSRFQHDKALNDVYDERCAK